VLNINLQSLMLVVMSWFEAQTIKGSF